MGRCVPVEGSRSRQHPLSSRTEPVTFHVHVLPSLPPRLHGRHELDELEAIPTVLGVAEIRGVRFGEPVDEALALVQAADDFPEGADGGIGVGEKDGFAHRCLSNLITTPASARFTFRCSTRHVMRGSASSTPSHFATSSRTLFIAPIAPSSSHLPTEQRVIVTTTGSDGRSCGERTSATFRRHFATASRVW